jgi:hypothetical protein
VPVNGGSGDQASERCSSVKRESCAMISSTVRMVVVLEGIYGAYKSRTSAARAEWWIEPYGTAKAVPFLRKLIPFVERHATWRRDYSIFTSGAYRVTTPMAAFPQEKPHFAAPSCAE